MRVCVVHSGAGALLPRVFAACEAFAGRRPLLIGDAAARATLEGAGLEGPVDFLDLAELLQASPWTAPIRAAFRNDGPQSNAFELGCFLRFAALERAATRLGETRLLHLDSDLVLLNDLPGLLGIALNTHDYAGLDESSTYLGAWRLPLLRRWLDFLPGYFAQETPAERLCDMSALKQFLRETRPAAAVFTLRQGLAGTRFNSNINCSVLFQIMQHSGQWSHDWHRRNSLDCRGIFTVEGAAMRYRGQPLDFLHFQGITKRYADTILEGLRLPALPSSSSCPDFPDFKDSPHGRHG